MDRTGGARVSSGMRERILKRCWLVKTSKSSGWDRLRLGHQAGCPTRDSQVSLEFRKEGAPAGLTCEHVMLRFQLVQCQCLWDTIV